MAIRVETAPNCGNAPRHEITRRFAVALAGSDATELESLLSPDAEWDVLGKAACRGLPAIIETVALAAAVVELRVLSVITHGREASIDGEAVFKDGAVMNFCHVLRFANTAKTAAITKIRTYHAASNH
ncbi:hypothetical protein [Arthrobacter caoxuetaonis]|uniref:hypothetical protein n=1 Tax=Arthrobacter caoxuetaonis TaxID=2886935 RepID=UPI001D1464E2|nr:hypothetical protein [Arthrobacter caoxuetaonis]MCC3283588.1 hypothetical protein [Arthrobacter caoxuetaonis]